MRGNYFSDVDSIERATRQANGMAPTPKVDNTPTIVPSPETPSTPADIVSIVTYVAFQCLLTEFNWSETKVRKVHPALNGITAEQVRAVITEALI